MISTLISTYFGSRQLVQTMKINCVKFQIFDTEKCSKWSGTAFSATSFPIRDQKGQDKNLNILSTKSSFIMK